MSVLIKITNPNRLSMINDIIHDCWFELEDVIFDERSSKLEIRFKREAVEDREAIGWIWPLKKYRIPLLESSLQIFHVEFNELKDKARIGGATFNVLRYYPNSSKVEVLTCTDVTIVAKVRKLEILVEESDHVVDAKTCLYLFGL